MTYSIAARDPVSGELGVAKGLIPLPEGTSIDAILG
jgi:hypothetical protein